MKKSILFILIATFTLVFIIGCVGLKETQKIEGAKEAKQEQTKKFDIDKYKNPESSFIAEIANLIIEKLES